MNRSVSMAPAFLAASLLLAICASACSSSQPTERAATPSRQPLTADNTVDCSDPNLTWNPASKTTFTSYPAPGSSECIDFSGCQYQGQFAACSNKQSIDWVQSHNIVAVHSNAFGALRLHDLCLRSGSSTIAVTVYDECSDSDCSGCCTKNAQPSGNLVDVESFTNARWGIDDGQIEWADLGSTSDCN